VGAALFEAIALSGAEVEVHGTARRRGSSAQAVPIGVETLGFDREIKSPARGREIDQLLPYDPRSYDGYRLLHEFFALPDRFHFIRLAGLDKALFGKSEQSFQVLFRLPRAFPELTGKLGREAVRTNCVPAVNLFERQADDITITGRQVEHHILPDRGDPTGYEIHSVLSVIGRTKSGEDQIFRPFFAQPGLGERIDGPRRYYALNRVPRAIPAQREERDKAMDDYRGSEINLSIVDDSALPVSTDLRALTLKLRCTNRHLPLYAMGVTGADAELKSAIDLGWDAIQIVAGPSAPRPGLPVGRKLWDAISHLSQNYLSLVEAPGTDAAAPMRQLMRLYVPDSPPRAARIADSLRSVSAKQIVKRIAGAQTKSRAIAPVTFARGLEIALVFENQPPEAATLAAILDRFLAGYVSANSFTRTKMRRPDGVERLRWNPNSGSKTTL
jgi:type VI secretion system protein ImpG